MTGKQGRVGGALMQKIGVFKLIFGNAPVADKSLGFARPCAKRQRAFTTSFPVTAVTSSGTHFLIREKKLVHPVKGHF